MNIEEVVQYAKNLKALADKLLEKPEVFAGDDRLVWVGISTPVPELYFSMIVRDVEKRGIASRKARGNLQRLFNGPPEIFKEPDEDGLEARWDRKEFQIRLRGYLPKTCRIVEEEVHVPEEPAREAVPARMIRRRTVQCD